MSMSGFLVLEPGSGSSSLIANSDEEADAAGSPFVVLHSATQAAWHGPPSAVRFGGVSPVEWPSRRDDSANQTQKPENPAASLFDPDSRRADSILHGRGLWALDEVGDTAANQMPPGTTSATVRPSSVVAVARSLVPVKWSRSAAGSSGGGAGTVDFRDHHASAAAAPPPPPLLPPPEVVNSLFAGAAGAAAADAALAGDSTAPIDDASVTAATTAAAAKCSRTISRAQAQATSRDGSIEDGGGGAAAGADEDALADGGDEGATDGDAFGLLGDLDEATLRSIPPSLLQLLQQLEEERDKLAGKLLESDAELSTLRASYQQLSQSHASSQTWLNQLLNQQLELHERRQWQRSGRSSSSSIRQRAPAEQPLEPPAPPSEHSRGGGGGGGGGASAAFDGNDRTQRGVGGAPLERYGDVEEEETTADVTGEVGVMTGEVELDGEREEGGPLEVEAVQEKEEAEEKEEEAAGALRKPLEASGCGSGGGDRAAVAAGVQCIPQQQLLAAAVAEVAVRGPRPSSGGSSVEGTDFAVARAESTVALAEAAAAHLEGIRAASGASGLAATAVVAAAASGSGPGKKAAAADSGGYSRSSSSSSDPGDGVAGGSRRGHGGASGGADGLDRDASGGSGNGGSEPAVSASGGSGIDSAGLMLIGRGAAVGPAAEAAVGAAAPVEVEAGQDEATEVEVSTEVLAEVEPAEAATGPAAQPDGGGRPMGQTVAWVGTVAVASEEGEEDGKGRPQGSPAECAAAFHAATKAGLLWQRRRKKQPQQQEEQDQPGRFHGLGFHPAQSDAALPPPAAATTVVATARWPGFSIRLPGLGASLLPLQALALALLSVIVVVVVVVLLPIARGGFGGSPGPPAARAAAPAAEPAAAAALAASLGGFARGTPPPAGVGVRPALDELSRVPYGVVSESADTGPDRSEQALEPISDFRPDTDNPGVDGTAATAAATSAAAAAPAAATTVPSFSRLEAQGPTLTRPITTGVVIGHKTEPPQPSHLSACNALRRLSEAFCHEDPARKRAGDAASERSSSTNSSSTNSSSKANGHQGNCGARRNDEQRQAAGGSWSGDGGGGGGGGRRPEAACKALAAARVVAPGAVQPVAVAVRTRMVGLADRWRRMVLEAKRLAAAAAAPPPPLGHGRPDGRQRQRGEQEADEGVDLDADWVGTEPAGASQLVAAWATSHWFPNLQPLVRAAAEDEELAEALGTAHKAVVLAVRLCSETGSANLMAQVQRRLDVALADAAPVMAFHMDASYNGGAAAAEAALAEAAHCLSRQAVQVEEEDARVADCRRRCDPRARLLAALHRMGMPASFLKQHPHWSVLDSDLDSDVDLDSDLDFEVWLRSRTPVMTEWLASAAAMAEERYGVAWESAWRAARAGAAAAAAMGARAARAAAAAGSASRTAAAAAAEAAADAVRSSGFVDSDDLGSPWVDLTRAGRQLGAEVRRMAAAAAEVGAGAAAWGASAWAGVGAASSSSSSSSFPPPSPLQHLLTVLRLAFKHQWNAMGCGCGRHGVAAGSSSSSSTGADRRVAARSAANGTDIGKACATGFEALMGLVKRAAEAAAAADGDAGYGASYDYAFTAAADGDDDPWAIGRRQKPRHDGDCQRQFKGGGRSGDACDDSKIDRSQRKAAATGRSSGGSRSSRSRRGWEDRVLAALPAAVRRFRDGVEELRAAVSAVREGCRGAAEGVRVYRQQRQQ